jgi:geranylgeranyl pyrophosphate synthase
VTNELNAFIARHRQTLDDALDAHLPMVGHRAAGRLNDAVYAAVFPGGKRMRPLLTLMGAQAAGISSRAALPAAVAIEYLHSSSLIFDDMPAMDDAAQRRGRAALHIEYGEGVAMLAALALLNQAYSLLARAAEGNGARPVAQLINEATACIGANGMIGGQAADIERQSANDSDTLAMRNLKTTALLRLAMTAGALAGGAKPDDVAALAYYGESLGYAYQVYDDLLDEVGNSNDLGKPAGQDVRHGRPSFVAQLGTEGAHALTINWIEQAKSAIAAQFGCAGAAQLLNDAADFIFGDVRGLKFAAGMVA